MAALLEIENLRTTFNAARSEIRAVDGVTLRIEAGQAMGLVGESGCGKSVTALSVMRLIPKSAGRIAGGRILYRGRDLAGLGDEEMRRIRGKEIAMIFQEPMTSLNPLLTIGYQLIEAIRLHQDLSAAAARSRAIEMLDLVRIPEPRLRLKSYPHQLSGGMRQRVMIAMALSCRPSLLVADEPTTALDVTIQAQILALIGDLRRELGMALLLITHDLGVVAEQADEVAVMYAGRIVERGKPADLFSSPCHPYTAGLLASIPSGTSQKGTRRLEAIPGIVPSPLAWPTGCRFRDRCRYAQPACAETMPELVEHRPGRLAACHFPLAS